MKTDNPNNYRLVSSVFKAFCEDHGLTPYNNPVTFEHDGFSCIAHRDDTDFYYRAVDAVCRYCEDETVDYCFNCGRRNQIDFELV